MKIKVISSSYNPVDSMVRGGFMNPVLPKVPSGDVAGIVVERDDISKVRAPQEHFPLQHCHGTTLRGRMVRSSRWATVYLPFLRLSLVIPPMVHCPHISAFPRPCSCP